MNFELTEEQTEVQALARKILEDYCANEQLRKFDKSERFSPDLWQELATAGLLGVAIDEQYGGMGFDFETLCLLIEEVGRTVAPVPVLPVLAIAAQTIQMLGSEQLKRDTLPEICNGKSLITAAVSEPVSYGFAPASVTAVNQDRLWVLDGEKYFVPFANRASHMIVSACNEDTVALFLVPMDLPGMVLEEQLSTAGENQFSIRFNQCSVPDSHCLASGDEASTALQNLQNHAIAASAAQMVGVCEVMMRTTASYTSEREQFGVKVATFQAVGQRAADCYIDVECLRLVTQQAVFAVANCDLPEAVEACAVAKIWMGDTGHRVSHAAQHLHGGMGVDRDYSLWRYCLWAKQLELTFGNSAEYTERLGELIAAQFKSAV